MKTASAWLALFPLSWAMLLTGCYTTSSVPCDGEPGGFCKQGFVCTKKAPFVCVLEGDLCGNGEIDSGEQCDDGNREAGDGCSPDCRSNYLCGNAVVDAGMGGGASEECDPKEDNESVQAQGKDKPATDSSSTCDADCTEPTCGDAFVNHEFVAIRHQGASGEECDPAEDDPKITPTDGKPQQAKGDSKKCNYDCTEAACGDGYVNKKFPIKDFRSGDTILGEECDPAAEPGSTATTSGLPQRASANTASCDLDCTQALCGDGLVNQFFQIEKFGTNRQLTGEECDPGAGDPNIGAGVNAQRASADGATCDMDCTLAKCGDGHVNKEAGEACDPGTDTSDISSPDDPKRATADGANECLATCKVGRCGDKHVNEAAGEECDDGNKDETDDCSNDCKNLLCGNGRQDTGEECDGGLGCSPDCKRQLCGNGVQDQGESCDLACDFALFPGGCVDGDCVVPSDTSCELSRCGDGYRNSSGTEREECDATEALGPRPGPVASAACDADCTFSMCGDGLRNDQAEIWPITGTSDSPVRVGGSAQSGGEECEPTVSDDPRATLADPFLATVDSERCDRDCTLASCGDGYVNEAAQELCDDGPSNTAQCNGPTAGPTLMCHPSFCGDGYQNTASGEQCDPDSGGTTDPLEASSDAASCDKDCSPAVCGDGYINGSTVPPEVCDDSGESADCDTNCTPARCGDGQVNRTFVIDPVGTASSQVGEECDPGTILGDVSQSGNPQRASQASSACDEDCTAPRCGDGYANSLAGEACDTGGNSVTCDSNCTLAFCGDGFQNDKFPVTSLGSGTNFPGEACDPSTGAGPSSKVADRDSQDCDRDCTGVRCGDGYRNVEAGEQCDNDIAYPNPPNSNDGCSNTCQLEGCGDGEKKGGESCDPDTGVDGVLCTGGPVGSMACVFAEQDTSGCDLDCTNVQCGDGHINTEAGEACDPATGAGPNSGTAAAATATCSTTCQTIP